MSLTVRSSGRRRRRKDPDEKLPESTSAAAQVMAPTRMKLRVRRRDNAAAGAAGGDQPEEEEEEEEEGRSRESGGRRRRKTTAGATSTAAAADASSWSPPPPPSSSSSASARVAMAAEEASPDSKCPICLDRFNNLAYLDRCLHRFCFPCIQEWSHNKAECPLCKQPFASILHSVRAEDDFKEYTLRPPPANSSVAATVAMVAAMASAARSDHQMRLMLRRHRGGEATTRRRRRGERGGGRRSGVWEWYLDSPPLALPPLPHPAVSPVVAEDSEEGEEPGAQRTRGGADVAERGVIFEGLTGLGGAVEPAAPNDRASRRLMTRLVARQRLQREGGTVRRLRERETVAFRRALYRNAIRVRGVPGVNVTQQQRDITAESFRRNPTHLNRLRPWLRRELTVLYGAHGSLVDIVQRIIMARVARHGLEDTPTIEEELRQFLLARTDHFLHELVSFARSPLGLESYDLQAAYEPPDAAMELDGTSSPSDGSSVIAISEGEEEERPAGGRSEEERLLAMAGGAHDDVIQSGSCLSLAVWDDETPGPSYSTAEPSCSLASPPFGHAPREAANGMGGEEEECLIVGYKKPIAERTPELVQLSSDTEEEEEKKKKKKEEEEDTAEELPPLPPSTPTLSYLPTIPPSTSGAYGGEPKEKDGSWSGSSGGSRNSVCALSPAAPGDGKSGGEAARVEEEEKKKKKKKKKKRRKRKTGRERRKSGTLYNPNRSIYPAMMRHRSRSSSPLRSSVGSGSPDSTWEYHCSRVSPLTSSASSPSRCSSSSSSSSSSSPFCTSSPPPAAAMPSLSPGDHAEKPGGKRKYKSRHLDSDDKDPTWRPSSREEEGGRRKGRRRERKRSGGERRSRADRSPSVEIIYEGTVSPNASQPPAHKRRRRRQRKTQQHSSSPVIITLDSDSSLDEDGSSSPISSQQTVDFSDLPPLPSVRSDGVGGALGAEIGELPVDILDRGSDGSEAAAGPVAVDNSDDSVDVENVEDVEESGLLLGSDEEEDEEEGGPMGASAANRRASNPIGKRDLALSSSDSRLLASILDDLKGIGPPAKRKPPVTFDAGVTEAHSNRDVWLAEARPLPDGVDRKRGFELPACRSAIRPPPPPPLERLKEVKDVPPLLKQASPVRSYIRNTPPPLKHKDAGSPHLSPVSPANPLSPRAAFDPLSVNSHVDLNSNPVDSRAEDDPPVSTLKRHLAIDVQSSCHLAPVDSHSTAPSEAEAVGIDPTGHKPPADTRCSSSSGSENRFTSADRFLHLQLNSSSKSHSVDLHPVNCLPAIDFHLAKTGWSNEKPAHIDSTSRGFRDKTDWTNSCLVAPVDPHPCSGVSAEGSHGGGVFSGVNRYDTSPPAFVSAIDFRNRSHPSSPVDSHSFSKREGLSRGSSVPTAAPGLSPIDMQPSPKSTVDLHSSSATPEGLTDSRASSLVHHGERSPYARLPPIDLHSTSPVPPASVRSSSSVSTTIDNHLNHTALSSATVDSHSKLLHLTHCLKPRNHFDPRSDPPVPIDDRSKRRFPVEPRSPVDSHPNNCQSDVQLPADHRTEENRWNSKSGEEHSADSVWNTHTHSAT
ncbi:E3 ubiquitin-protein ligase Topors-like [Cebidichthys violaceus]|uniref:E3 ubiquitin-protein ligase Topors-like n=1 Tax=Cebidichthys violaceus TaxID=271503 RepID=UPI0035C9A832